MIIGVDIGYSTTKTSTGLCFNSRIGSTDGLETGEYIVIDGTEYAIGCGLDCLDVNRINSEFMRICLFAALVMSEPNETDFNVVTGLPIGQYKTHKEKLYKSVMDQNVALVEYKGKSKIITIKELMIYAQGAGALYAQDINNSAIIVDIGSRTTDIALFEVEGGRRSLTKSNTLYCGMLGLNSTVIASVNSKFDLGLPRDYAQQIFYNGLSVDGIEQNLDFLKPILTDYLKDLFAELTLNYPIRNTPIYLCGGGALVLGGIFKNKYGHATILPNAQFSNAVGFGKVGEAMWQYPR